MTSQAVDSFLPLCPALPYAGVCEPSEDEPGRCAYGEHPVPANLPNPLLTEALASFLHAKLVKNGMRRETSWATDDEETRAELRRTAAEVLAWLAATTVDLPPVEGQAP